MLALTKKSVEKLRMATGQALKTNRTVKLNHRPAGGSGPGIVFADCMITQFGSAMAKCKVLSDFETMLNAPEIDVWVLDSQLQVVTSQLGNDVYPSNQFSLFDGTEASWEVATIVTIRKKAKMNNGVKEYFWVFHSPRFFRGLPATYVEPEPEPEV